MSKKIKLRPLTLPAAEDLWFAFAISKRAGLVGLIGVLFSWAIRFMEMTFEGQDHETFIFVGFTGFIFFHGILASTLATKVTERHQRIRECIRDKDQSNFNFYRADKTLNPMKILTGILSFVLVLSASLIRYESQSAGVINVFLMTFILSAFWVYLAEMDNPLTAMWCTDDDDLPKGWIADGACSE